MFYAHSTISDDRSDWEPLPTHLDAVANHACALAASVGIDAAARLAGALHDLGKFNPNFQAYLRGERSSVPHAIAGARAILDLPFKGYDRWIAWLVAQAIAGHHAGLPNRRGAEAACLEERLKEYDPAHLDEAWLGVMPSSLEPLLPSFDFHAPDNPRGAFRFALLGRMIFSCLVDADFKETERFYNTRGEVGRDRDWPALSECLGSFRAAFDQHMAEFGVPATPIARLRAKILFTVRERAAMAPGLFTLNVPTGGGKTLASLGFALDHAARHGHRRIIYAIPFTSIIDQTAAIFREVLGAEFVLEHHSAIEEDRTGPSSAESERSGRNKLRLAMEDWAAPVVVTTHVQLFESLFAARTSRCCKLHNIAGSIIVLDEAQTLPRGLLAPTVWAIDELARNYGCSIVLCTATQPAFDESRLEKKHVLGLKLAGRELAPDPARLQAAFARVRLVFGGEMADDALVAALAEAPLALVIVNSRRHALDLYRLAQSAGLDGLVHLTTRQHAADRRRILDGVRARLTAGRPCRLIATSLVEAGVDLDFPVGWRAEVGLDQIAQAAGRINREGARALEDSVLTVFRPADPDHAPPREVRGLIGSMERMREAFDELFAPEAIERYFHEVYWSAGDKLDAEGIAGMASVSPKDGPDIAYRCIAEKYRMVEDGMAPVIVAVEDEAREAVKKLGVPTISSGVIARNLQPYVVSVPPKARALLITNGHVSFEQEQLRGAQFAILQTPSLYDERVGLLWENAEYLSIDNTVV